MPTVSTGRAAASERMRMLAVFAVMALGILFLGATLHHVQVVETSEYSDALEQHSMRRVRLPSTRGRILDRRGVALADNRPSYCVALFVEELRQRGAWSNTINAVDALVDELAFVIGRPREIDRDAIAAHIHRRRPLPLLAWKALDDRALARLAECPQTLRGVDVYVQPDRIYPLQDCAAHVVGYVGKGEPATATNEEAEVDYDFYLPDLVGRQGIENRYDSYLAGSPGGQLIRVDAVGYKHEAHTGREPVRGKDVTLTLDTRLQRVAEQSLEGFRAAVVVLDCETGEVLVMASAPRYDLSAFVPTLSQSLWDRLRNDRGHPMLNRAAAGIYPPGSIFKLVVALAALDQGAVTPETTVHCPGYYTLPNGSKLRCWFAPGHGDVGMQHAIEQSCNTYFCQIGVTMGYEPHLHADCALLGLGSRPNIEVPAEAGNLPSDEWKRRRWRDGWRTGDTANLSIGQGFLSVTPLQMAVMTAAIANGGMVLRPRLVLEPRDSLPPVVARMPWKASSLRTVRRGMYDVVQAPTGTGKHARIDGCTLAGKTGTAEYYDRGVRRKHAWMVAYGPFEQPRYAIAVVVENSDSGGRAAAPIVHRVLSAVFDRPANPAIIPVPIDAELPEALRDVVPDAPLEDVETTEAPETVGAVRPKCGMRSAECGISTFGTPHSAFGTPAHVPSHGRDGHATVLRAFPQFRIPHSAFRIPKNGGAA